MKKKLAITLIATMMTGCGVYILLFNILIKPKIGLLNLKREQKILIESRPSNKKTSKKSVLHPVKEITLILEQETKKNHCLIEQLSTDLKNTITAKIMANYQSIIHILQLIASHAVGINCYHASIGKSKRGNLLQLKLKCKYHDQTI